MARTMARALRVAAFETRFHIDSVVVVFRLATVRACADRGKMKYAIGMMQSDEEKPEESNRRVNRAPTRDTSGRGRSRSSQKYGLSHVIRLVTVIIAHRSLCFIVMYFIRIISSCCCHYYIITIDIIIIIIISPVFFLCASRFRGVLARISPYRCVRPVAENSGARSSVAPV